MADSPPKSKPKSKKPIFTAKNVRRVLPLVSAGVELLGSYRPARPYVKAVRTVTAAAAFMGDDEQPPKDLCALIAKLKEIRLLAVAAEKAKDAESTVKLRIHQDIYTDLLLERLQEE